MSNISRKREREAISPSISPAPAPAKKLNSMKTPKTNGTQPRWVRPHYPRREDRTNLTNVTIENTLKKLDKYQPGDSRHENPHSEHEALLMKIESKRAPLRAHLENKLVSIIDTDLTAGNDTDINDTANKLSLEVLKKVKEYLEPDVPEDITLPSIMADLAEVKLQQELPYCKNLAKNKCSPELVKRKRAINSESNPFYGLFNDVIDDMLKVNAGNLGTVRGAGLLAKLDSNLHLIENSTSENSSRLDLVTDQLAKLTAAVTDKDNEDCLKKLIIFGLGKHITTAASRDPITRSKREEEAAKYLKETIGFKGPMMIGLTNPSGEKSPVAFVTLAFESDKFRLERMIAKAKNEGKSQINSKRFVSEDKPYQNPPKPEEFQSSIKIIMRNQLTKAKASAGSLANKEEILETLETYDKIIVDHDFMPRKQIYNKESSIQYEFLCPMAEKVWMVYKGDKTFEDYDFLSDQPNPVVRRYESTDPGGKYLTHKLVKSDIAV